MEYYIQPGEKRNVQVYGTLRAEHSYVLRDRVEYCCRRAPRRPPTGTTARSTRRPSRAGAAYSGDAVVVMSQTDALPNSPRAAPTAASPSRARFRRAWPLYLGTGRTARPQDLLNAGPREVAEGAVRLMERPVSPWACERGQHAFVTIACLGTSARRNRKATFSPR